jgi:hypothetical protein
MKLTSIDHEMCAHFGHEPDGMGYYYYWNEVIASRLARGEEFDRIRTYFVERRDHYASSIDLKSKECHQNYSRLVEITEWLTDNFTPSTEPHDRISA